MKRPVSPWSIALSALLLAGCDAPSEPADSGFGDATAPSGMAAACLAQATRLTGKPTSAIKMRDPIATGGGPFIGMTIDGVSYGCRTEADGTYTVFSQYAN